jgi:hypothetical protein
MHQIALPIFRFTSFLVVLLLAIGCKGQSSITKGQGSDDPNGRAVALLSQEESRAVDFVYVSGKEGPGVKGGTSPAKIIVKPNPSHEVRVAVFEEYSGGAGSQWRASVWMSSFLAASTLGHQLTDYEFGVSTGGFVDGPSAGALTTAAMLAAMTGARVRPEVTMTGTVNPDGTIGPVGGIPQKIRGAAEKGKTTFGYPVGQRYDRDLANDQMVDLHSVATDKKVTAKEVKDIFEAYELVTGRTLFRPQPLDASAMEISSKIFQRMQAKTTAWLARAESTMAVLMQQGEPNVLLKPYLKKAENIRKRAFRYQTQGMVPVAFQKALESAGLCEVINLMGRLLPMISKQDFAGLLRENQALSAVKADYRSYFTRLGTEEINTAAAAINVMAGYKDAVYVWSFMEMVEGESSEMEQLIKLMTSGKLNQAQTLAAKQQLLGHAFLRVLYLTVGKLMLESGLDTLDLGESKGTQIHLEPASLSRLAKAYSSAAKANLDYYDAIILETEAQKNGASLAAAQSAKAQSNLLYRLAHKTATYAITNRDEEGVSAALAGLAAATSSYILSARLVAEEYSLVVRKDQTGEAVEVQRDKAMIAMLEQGELKAREMAALAKEATGAVPCDSQIAYQRARALREGTVDEKLDALQNYWASSVESQLTILIDRSSK